MRLIRARGCASNQGDCMSMTLDPRTRFRCACVVTDKHHNYDDVSNRQVFPKFESQYGSGSELKNTNKQTQLTAAAWSELVRWSKRSTSRFISFPRRGHVISAILSRAETSDTTKTWSKLQFALLQRHRANCTCKILA